MLSTKGSGLLRIFTQYKGLRKEVYILIFGRLVTAMGSMIWPVLTLILNQKLGLSAAKSAAIVGAAGLLMIPTNLLGGYLADHFCKKDCIIICDLVSIISYLICGFMKLNLACGVLIILAAASQNMENSSYNALFADLSKTKDREKVYSLEYLCCNLGFVIAPTMAGLLFDNYLWLSFLISGSAIGISTILIFFLVKDVHTEEETDQKAFYQEDRHGQSILSVLKDNRAVFFYLLTMALYWAAYAQYTFLMPLDLAAMHGSKGAVLYGSITSVNAITVVIFTPVFTSLLSSVTILKKSLSGQILMTAGYLIFLIFSGKIPVYYAAMVLFTFGEVLTTITNGPYLTERIPASHRGRINGMMFVFQAIMQSILLWITGFIYDGVGRNSAWTFVLFLCGLVIICGSILIPWDRKNYPMLYEFKNNKV